MPERGCSEVFTGGKISLIDLNSGCWDIEGFEGQATQSGGSRSNSGEIVSTEGLVSRDMNEDI